MCKFIDDCKNDILLSCINFKTFNKKKININNMWKNFKKTIVAIIKVFDLYSIQSFNELKCFVCWYNIWLFFVFIKLNSLFCSKSKFTSVKIPRIEKNNFNSFLKILNIKIIKNIIIKLNEISLLALIIISIFIKKTKNNKNKRFLFEFLKLPLKKIWLFKISKA